MEYCKHPSIACSRSVVKHFNFEKGRLRLRKLISEVNRNEELEDFNIGKRKLTKTACKTYENL